MRVLPFKRFIITFLLLGEGQEQISKRLEKFGFAMQAEAFNKIVAEISSSLPDKYKTLFDAHTPLNPDDADQLEWFKFFLVDEFALFCLHRNDQEFKWYEDCLWILGHVDVSSLVNILMFNGDDNPSVSDVISFKYKKKIGVEALDRYRHIFWDCSAATAKDLLASCPAMEQTSMIIRNMRSSGVVKDDVGSDGSDVEISFHGSDYIKWKIGFPTVKVPTASEFFGIVMKDSYFKYLEAMTMAKSVEVEAINGYNDKLGSYNETRQMNRNVEEQRAKAAKAYLDMFERASKYKAPGDKDASDSFFERIKQLTIAFDEEKIIPVEENKELFDDIQKR